MSAGIRLRGVALALFLAGLIVLAVSRALHPDPRGLGTHEQLGLPPCGFAERTHLPCPTCGVTTSFAHFARGEVSEAFRVHPLAGALFVALVGATALGGSAALLGGRWLERLARANEALRWRRLLSVGLIVWLAYWGFEIVKAVAQRGAGA